MALQTSFEFFCPQLHERIDLDSTEIKCGRGRMMQTAAVGGRAPVRKAEDIPQAPAIQWVDNEIRC
jgi:hypothetical protein